MNASSGRRYWYPTFRYAFYAGMLVSLVWSLLMVAPIAPLSDAPRIVVQAPGIWLLVAYLVYVSVGTGLFAWLSALLSVIERQEGREVDGRFMLPGFVLLLVGVTASCGLMAYAGATGGYAHINGTTFSLSQMLLPYVDPITALASVGILGGGLVLLAMVRARVP
jgi:hypothetical protein